MPEGGGFPQTVTNPGSWFTGLWLPWCHAGLLESSPHQAATACSSVDRLSPSARTDLAALRSRSWCMPQLGHSHSRTSKSKESSTWPQALQVLRIEPINFGQGASVPGGLVRRSTCLAGHSASSPHSRGLQLELGLGSSGANPSRDLSHSSITPGKQGSVIDLCQYS